MSNNINLSPSKRRTNQYQEELLKTVKKISVIFLVITVISAVGLFLLDINPSLSYILQQKNATLTNLSFTHGKAAKYLLIKDRIQSINSIIQGRSSFDDVIASLEQQIPTDVAVDSLSIDRKTVTVNVSSTSLSSCDTLLTNITQMLQEKKIIKAISIDTITEDQSVGKFVLSMRLDLL